MWLNRLINIVLYLLMRGVWKQPPHILLLSFLKVSIDKSVGFLCVLTAKTNVYLRKKASLSQPRDPNHSPKSQKFSAVQSAQKAAQISGHAHRGKKRDVWEDLKGRKYVSCKFGRQSLRRVEGKDGWGRRGSKWKTEMTGDRGSDNGGGDVAVYSEIILQLQAIQLQLMAVSQNANLCN